MEIDEPDEPEIPSRSRLIMHPVRFRILLALSGRELTTAQIAAEMPDVPATSLYRQIQTLHRGGILRVAGERATRGAVERRWMFREEDATTTLEEAEGYTPQVIARSFHILVDAMLDQFRRYLTTAGANPRRDGMRYLVHAVSVSPEEHEQLVADLVARVEQVVSLPPAPHRRRIFLFNVAIPQSGTPDAPEPERNTP